MLRGNLFSGRVRCPIQQITIAVVSFVSFIEMTCVDPWRLLVILNVNVVLISLSIQSFWSFFFIVNAIHSVNFISFVRHFFGAISINLLFRILIFTKRLFNFVNSVMVGSGVVFLKIMIWLNWLPTSKSMDRRRPTTFVLHVLECLIYWWIAPWIPVRNDIHFSHWLINLVILWCASWLRTHPLI